jgi:DNA-binding CsgD family transcriptional regulator
LRAVRFRPDTASALLAALRLSRQHGGATAALRAAGIDLPETERFEGLADEVAALLGPSATDPAVAEAWALGFLAGGMTHHRRRRTAGDPTSFVLDEHLVVQGAVGESVLRLPWFDPGLFVGEQFPDISEIPTRIRSDGTDAYRSALAGTRCDYSFTSYGHTFTVEAVPVRGDDGTVEAALVVATPVARHVLAAAGYERTAERLERSATLAEQRAQRARLAARGDEEEHALRAARKARLDAERMRAHARRLRSRDNDDDNNGGGARSAALSVTPREIEVLRLASHGLTSRQIGEHLGVSAATIRTHLENVYAKLGVGEKAAAVAAALRHGLID